MAMNNNLAITNLIQSWEYAHTYHRYVAIYKIDESQVFEHELTLCDYRFIFLERMQYGNQMCNSLLLDSDDCLKWCLQANKLIGILKQESVFLPDDMFDRIYDAHRKSGAYISMNVFRESSNGRRTLSQMRNTFDTTV